MPGRNTTRAFIFNPALWRPWETHEAQICSWAASAHSRNTHGLPHGKRLVQDTRSLPIERTGDLRYRIKSESEGFERVVDESTLTLTT
jgi:hypothetical protein